MSERVSRLSGLFSLDRLRRTWSDEPEPARPAAPPPEPPLILFARFRELALARYSSPAAAPLAGFLDELGEKLAARYPAGRAEVAAAAELDKRINALLDIIEDFTDALEVGARRR